MTLRGMRADDAWLANRNMRRSLDLVPLYVAGRVLVVGYCERCSCCCRRARPVHHLIFYAPPAFQRLHRCTLLRTRIVSTRERSSHFLLQSCSSGLARGRIRGHATEDGRSKAASKRRRSTGAGKAKPKTKRGGGAPCRPSAPWGPSVRLGARTLYSRVAAGHGSRADRRRRVRRGLTPMAAQGRRMRGDRRQRVPARVGHHGLLACALWPRGRGFGAVLERGHGATDYYPASRRMWDRAAFVATTKQWTRVRHRLVLLHGRATPFFFLVQFSSSCAIIFSDPQQRRSPTPFSHHVVYVRTPRDATTQAKQSLIHASPLSSCPLLASHRSPAAASRAVKKQQRPWRRKAAGRGKRAHSERDAGRVK